MTAAAAPAVAYAECFCGQTEAFPASIGLPAGWKPVTGQNAVQCPDCVRGAQLELIPAQAAKGGHHGCRLIYNIVGADTAVLRIHAGANPVGNTADIPVLFIARAGDLDQLIDRLAVIRAALKEGNPYV